MKGIYVLIIELTEDTDIHVGAIGTLRFTKGIYAYVGSAQTNLEKRVERHLRKEKRKFWHIDYVLDHAGSKIIKVFVVDAGKTQECKIAKRIGERGVTVSRFGSSDCSCRGHLVRLSKYESFQEFAKELDLAPFVLGSN